MEPTVSMQTLCTPERGWHVRMEWSDGFVDHFQPKNGGDALRPGTDMLMLDIWDCRLFRLNQGEKLP